MLKNDLLKASFTRAVWKNRRVLILGLGQYPKGSGISSALMFARLGAHVTVTDLKSRKDLALNVKRLASFKNVRFRLGGHDVDDIRKAELIVANPRVRPSSKELMLARKHGIPVTSDIALFLDRCPASVIAVTGTRGKSTTASLIFHILKAGHRRVWLGGNILVSPLTFLSKVKKRDVVVLELSSWQCESLSVTRAPHIAVITNLMRDHLNTYDGMEDYAEAKAQIFRHQGPKDIVILNADDAYGRRWMKEAPGIVKEFGTRKGAELVTGGSSLIGSHNRLNAIAASLAAQAAGISAPVIRRALKTFKPLSYRLELIRTIKGVLYVNDTCATTPDGTIAAVNALDTGKSKLFIIMGGADKELDYEEAGKVLQKRKGRIHVLLLPGSASGKIENILRSRHLSFTRVKDLREAIQVAGSHAIKGDTVVLSPGAASFGQFSNEFERGDVFNALVSRIKS